EAARRGAMIPKIIPPLTDLTVLVTRPAAQCGPLCAEIEHRGGAALAFPVIEIAPIESAPPSECDLAVFVSVNAVEHGAHLIRRTASLRIAAVGKATAAALAAAGLPADIVPDAGFDSEALLAHPDLTLPEAARVLIVRGDGGRNLLRDTFIARGATVEICEVYRRARPLVAPERLAELETKWAQDGVDVVTITSVQTLHNLLSLLSERGRTLLHR